ncbi:hypothetical protein M9H77_18028 [Catharanthus roseus]|uniref:Uncharacterized protein n=1 Tax=Catharanthus roseus TaxID=4058 RepID=A0ACC0B6B0_CATRO|nr:hypothetical protein M9H77_18028 [Catharanthus roseus]
MKKNKKKSKKEAEDQAQTQCCTLRSFLPPPVAGPKPLQQLGKSAWKLHLVGVAVPGYCRLTDWMTSTILAMSEPSSRNWNNNNQNSFIISSSRRESYIPEMAKLNNSLKMVADDKVGL